MSMKQILTTAQYLTIATKIKNRYGIDLSSQYYSGYMYGFIFKKNGVVAGESVKWSSSHNIYHLMVFELKNNINLWQYPFV